MSTETEDSLARLCDRQREKIAELTEGRVNLIYIGEKFYWESGTSMSSIYEQKGVEYRRWDWGKVSIALQRGEKLTIVPASAEQIKMFEAELAKMPRRGT